MSDTNEPNQEDEAKTAPTNSLSENGEGSSDTLHHHKKEHENGILDKDKDQELPELIREREGRRGLMSGMPSINLNELTVILRDPSMPSHKIMKEVADKIMLRSEESESDDGSVGSSGGVVGMKGLLDCIFEVTYEHTNSNNSDDEDEDFQKITREIPCNFCNKIFGSTMTWKTHVLVAHQDPSVLNIKQVSNSEGTNDKLNISCRKHSTASATKSEDDVKDHQVHQDLVKDKKQIAETLHEEQIVLSSRRYSSHLRSQQYESTDRHHSLTDQEKVTLLPVENVESFAVSSRDPMELNKDVIAETVEVNKHKIVESADDGIASDPTESGSRDTCLTDGEKKVRSSTTCCKPGLQDPDQISQEDSLSSKKKQQKEDFSGFTESIIKETDVSVNFVGERKRKAASPLSEPSSPASSSSSSLNPKRSRKHVAEEKDAKSTQKEDL